MNTVAKKQSAHLPKFEIKKIKTDSVANGLQKNGVYAFAWLLAHPGKSSEFNHFSSSGVDSRPRAAFR